jgi:hypothetical protein
MGADSGPGLLEQLWKHKFIIILALAVLVLAASTYYFYDLSNDRAAGLSQKCSEYDALNVTYYCLSDEHQALIVSHDNLTDEYQNLSYMYSSLSSNESSLKSAYDSLNASVSRIQEKNGPVIALTYRTYRGGTSQEPKLYVEATAYNVGNRKADKFMIMCRVIFDNQLNLNDTTFTNVEPLDKRTYTWEYSGLTQVDALWIK